MTITIVGAGVAGLSCALELATRGVDVEVLEKSTCIEQNACSWYAGGMLAPHCEGESAEAEIVELGLEAIGWWSKYFDGVECNGTLVVSQPGDQAELNRFSRRTNGHIWLDREGIGGLEEDLSLRFDRALYFEEEAHLNPRKALKALQQCLADRNVKIRFGNEFSQPVTASGMVIDCRGLGAKSKLNDLRGVRGEMLLLRTRDIHFTRTIRLLHPRFPVYVVPHGEGLYMIGATMIETDSTAPVTVRSIMDLLNAAVTLHPAFAEAEIIETGVGVRPAFPDNIPKVVCKNNVIYINGLYRHGFLLAPAMARQAADLVTGVVQQSGKAA